MSQGKLNSIPAAAPGLTAQIQGSDITRMIQQQGQVPAQAAPDLGMMPGTFGQPGGSVGNSALGLFDQFGAVPPDTGSGVNTPAPQDELDGLAGPDSMSQGY